MTAPRKHYPDTGFGPIDVEHAQISKGLTRLVDAAGSGKAAEAVEVLGELMEVTGRHFAHEEQLMAQSGYPLARQHEEAHGLFLADAGTSYAELLRDGLTAGVRRWAGGRALHWFRVHVAEHDVVLGHYLARWTSEHAGARAGDDAARFQSR